MIVLAGVDITWAVFWMGVYVFVLWIIYKILIKIGKR
jgi:hypothetical protein